MTARRGSVPNGDGPAVSTRCSGCDRFPAPHLLDRQGRGRLCCSCAHPARPATIDPTRVRVIGDDSRDTLDTDEVVDTLVDLDRPRDERVDQ